MGHLTELNQGSIAETQALAESSLTHQELIISLENLKSKTQKQLENLLSKQKVIKKSKSSYDIIMARYFVEKSYFEILAEWYNDLSWWFKIILAVAATALAAVIGVVLSLSLLATEIALVTFSLLVFILSDVMLTNYYQIAEERDQRYQEDITKLEKSLDEQVERLSLIEDNLNDTLQSLCQMNIEQISDSIKLKETIALLEEETMRFQNATTNTTNAVQSLSKTNENLQSFLQATTDKAGEINDALSGELQSFSETSQKISDTTTQLENESLRFSTIINEFVEINAENISLNAELRGLIRQFAQNREAFEPINPPTDDSTNNSHSSNIAQRRLQHSQLMSRCDEIRQRMTGPLRTTEASVNPETEQQSNHNTDSTEPTIRGLVSRTEALAHWGSAIITGDLQQARALAHHQISSIGNERDRLFSIRNNDQQNQSNSRNNGNSSGTSPTN